MDTFFGNRGDVSSSHANCCLAPYLGLSNQCHTCCCHCGAACWYLCRDDTTYPVIELSHVRLQQSKFSVILHYKLPVQYSATGHNALIATIKQLSCSLPTYLTPNLSTSKEQNMERNFVAIDLVCACIGNILWGPGVW